LSSTVITLLISEFNILLTTFLALVAICGVISIVCERFRLKIFHRGGPFMRAFFIAVIIAFVAEIIFFNYKSYLKYFADGEFQTTEVSPRDSSIVLTTDSVVAKIIVNVNDDEVVASGLTFKNLDRRVTSVYVKPILFSKYEQVEIVILWTTEASTRRMKKTLYKGFPRDNFTAIQPHGKISELTIMFPGKIFFEDISQIAVNKRIPFYFSGLRLLVFSLLFFAIIISLKKELRARAAYFLFEYRFDPGSKKQRIVYAAVVAMLILYSWLCVYTTNSPQLNSPWHTAYSKYLVDAFINGRVDLDFGNPEKIAGAERPYDGAWLHKNGYKFDVDWTFDISLYKGKYYTYYGPVAAVLLYLPYKLITGNYLSHHGGVAVFATITVILLALLWRFLVKKYMPDARFAFYLLGFLALFFTSHLFIALRFPTIWTIVQVSSLTFTLAGVYLLLKSVENERISYVKLFFACLCLALVVGCRPNMLLASILVPVILWKRRSWKLAAFILIPYIMVAIPLCLYNYVRFDSIFEFGAAYHLGLGDGLVVNLLNPLGKIHRMFVTFVFYLFRVYTYSVHFPFVELVPTDDGFVTAQLGFSQYYNRSGGLINFPIVFCLLYILKKFQGMGRPKIFPLLLVFLIIAVINIVLYASFGVIVARYLMDCAVFIIIPALFCAYWWSDDETACVRPHSVRLGIVYVLFAASAFVGLCLSVTWYHAQPMYDPVLYRYLEYSLGIIERIV